MLFCFISLNNFVNICQQKCAFSDDNRQSTKNIFGQLSLELWGGVVEIPENWFLSAPPPPPPPNHPAGLIISGGRQAYCTSCGPFICGFKKNCREVDSLKEHHHELFYPIFSDLNSTPGPNHQSWRFNVGNVFCTSARNVSLYIFGGKAL